MNLNQVTLPASDLAESVRFYRGMGFRLIVDTPHYARFECPDGDATFSLHLDEPTSGNNALIYFESETLDVWHQQLKQRGYQFDSDPTDQRWLWREARLTDPAGNRLCLYYAGTNRKHPPWRVDSNAAKEIS